MSGRNMLNELEFANLIKDMPDRQLLEFTCSQVYEISIITQNHGKRISNLESRDRKAFGVTGGLGTFVGAIIVVVVDFFVRRS